MELISVVIPVYNVEMYLKRCLDSVLKQTYDNIEIILVDDGSKDSSGAICDSYLSISKKCKVIHKANGGLSDARNVGIENATGAYIVFVDSDDFIAPNLIEYLYGLIKKADADVSICDPLHCYPDDDVMFTQATKERIFSKDKAICEMLYQKSFLVSAWGKMYKKRLFTEIKFPVGMLFEDSAIMYRIFNLSDTIVYGDAKLYAYLHREDSITTKKFSIKDLDILKICNELDEFFEKDQIELLNASRAYHMSAALRIFMNAPRKDLYDEAIADCQTYIEQNFNEVISDNKIRSKLRYALYLYKYARWIMPSIYKKINRWK